MKDSLFGRSVNRRENPRQAFQLGILSEYPDQISRLALDGFINLLSLFIDAQLLDRRFNYWHKPNFTTPLGACLELLVLVICLYLVICDFGIVILTLFVRIHSQYNNPRHFSVIQSNLWFKR